MILFGWLTLLLFPIPGYLLQFYFNQFSIIEFLSLSDFKVIPIVYGLCLGIFYGFIAYLFMQAPFFEKVPVKINHLVRDMKLNVRDGLFLSLCAGIGEEFLFRQGIQPFIGPFITSILFSFAAAKASSTPYCNRGLVSIGSISLGTALVAGKKRVP